MAHNGDRDSRSHELCGSLSRNRAVGTRGDRLVLAQNLDAKLLSTGLPVAGEQVSDGALVPRWSFRGGGALNGPVLSDRRRLR